MPELNGIGYSEWTAEKQRIFSSLLRINLRMWDAILNGPNKKYFEGNFTYFDITAGDGVNDNYGDGSPIIFLKEISNHSMRWVAHFMEIEKVNVASLKAHCNYQPINNGYFNIYLGDHNELLKGWINNNANKVPGLLYCDPTGKMPNFELLSEFSKTWQSVDMLIALSATNKKRARMAFGHKSLIEELREINRKNIMVREPYGCHQWTFLYMTNGPEPEWKKENFYSISSETGMSILEKLNYTERELKNGNQPTLFELSRIS